MQIKIHRGINQIGGCVTEIKSKKDVKVNVANISKKCDAVFITHYHYLYYRINHIIVNTPKYCSMIHTWYIRYTKIFKCIKFSHN